MRNYLSVFTLYIQRSFTKIFLLLTTTSLFELILFIHNLNFGNITQNENFSNTDNTYLLGIEFILNQNKPLLSLLLISFITLTVILCIMGCEFSDKQGYTIRRLNISEKKTFLCQGIYSSVVFGLFIIIQVLIFYTMCVIYIDFATGHENSFEGLISNQTVFLAFYRNKLLHALMPMDNIFKHISNIIMIIALGFSTAAFPYFMRRKKLPFEAVLLIPIILINFASDWTEITYAFVIIGMSLFVTGSLITRISVEEQAYDK